MKHKYLVILTVFLFHFSIKAQTCNCEKEFLYIKRNLENNFAGFNDKLSLISKSTYDKRVKHFLKLTRDKFANDNCILIIREYLNQFKTNHIGFSVNFDVSKTDTAFVNQRPIFEITDQMLNRLSDSNSWEGIYYFTHDSSYKIAVIKNKTPLHDYVGVLLESKIPTWKRGMVKFEGKLVNDSLLFGLLYMKNHRPKLEGFDLGMNRISGDWVREGAVKQKRNSPDRVPYAPIAAKKISEKTFYIKISSFDPAYAIRIDSLITTHKNILDSVPNIVLDLRDNGGGSDYSWERLVPYLYTSPTKTIGVDILATETNIEGWRKLLQHENLSEENKTRIKRTIQKMEKNKGKWIDIAEDVIDSTLLPRAFPKKVAILINKGSGSATEQFLLLAKQSSKVILLGENSTGNLDYSNVRQIPFFCFPYMLRYATTRSRRLNVKQGIDNIGIAPDHYLTSDSDWIKEAIKILEH